VSSPFFDMVRVVVSSTMHVPIDRVTAESSHLNLEGWDSLANTSMLAQLAEHLEVEFSDDEMEEATSVASILRLLEAKVGSA
jgi:acyl carrier protein